MSDEVRPELRASDVDRELTAKQLRRHATAGRLTLIELDQRLAWAYDAKTIGDLQKLTSDLPELSKDPLEPVDLDKSRPADRPARRAQRELDRARRHGSPQNLKSRRALWGSYISVNLMLIVIWFLTSVTGDGGWYPWWLWVAGPGAVALIAGEIQHRTGGDRSIDS